MASKSNYDKKLVEKIIEEIAEGNSVKGLAKKYKIAGTTLMDWVHRDEHADHYTHAQEYKRLLREDELLEKEAQAYKEKTSIAVALYREAKDRIKWQCGKEKSPKDSDGAAVNVFTGGYNEFLEACKDPPKPEGKKNGKKG